MTATWFLLFVALMALAVVALCARYLGPRAALGTAAALLVWLAYVGVLSYRGVIADTARRPPGPAFLFVPILGYFVYAVVRARSVGGARVTPLVPLWILLGLQCFRVGVELFIHQLWVSGLAPKMLTFAGANVDIYIGATAPVVAWLSTRGRGGLKLALGWNVLGLLALANVVTRAVLTSPGPLNLIHAEVPNRMIGMFPYTFIPGFFVPLAVTLHLLALRSIIGRLRGEASGDR